MVSTPDPLNQLERDIVDDIEANQEDLFDLLRTLVRFRTPNPPGGNELGAQDWLSERFAELGLEVDRWDVLPDRPNVVGTLRGAGDGPSVILNAHIDVCEERLLDEWSSDPYEPVTKGRTMVGRGTTDVKCAFASFLTAIATLQRKQVVLLGDVIVESVIGEETGEPGTRDTIERGYRGDFAIVGEASRGRDLVACVGVVNCKIVIQSSETLHLVAKRLTTIAGGGLLGGNCIEKMALRIIPALNDLERQWAVVKGHPQIPYGVCTINVFRIEGGGNTFLLPDECVAYATVIYLPHESKEQVMAEVEERITLAAAQDDWLRANPPTVEWKPREYPIEFAPCAFDPTSTPVVSLVSAIRDSCGHEPLLGGRGGVTDAGWFSAADIPAVVFGPGEVGQAHAVDERVNLDDLVSHSKVIALFLLRYCGSEKTRSGHSREDPAG